MRIFGIDRSIKRWAVNAARFYKQDEYCCSFGLGYSADEMLLSEYFPANTLDEADDQFSPHRL